MEGNIVDKKHLKGSVVAKKIQTLKQGEELSNGRRKEEERRRNRQCYLNPAHL